MPSSTFGVPGSKRPSSAQGNYANTTGAPKSTTSKNAQAGSHVIPSITVSTASTSALGTKAATRYDTLARQNINGNVLSSSLAGKSTAALAPGLDTHTHNVANPSAPDRMPPPYNASAPLAAPPPHLDHVGNLVVSPLSSSPSDRHDFILTLSRQPTTSSWVQISSAGYWALS